MDQALDNLSYLYPTKSTPYFDELADRDDVGDEERFGIAVYMHVLSSVILLLSICYDTCVSYRRYLAGFLDVRYMITLASLNFVCVVIWVTLAIYVGRQPINDVSQYLIG